MTKPLNERLSQIRYCLSQPPSPDVWQQLCKEVDALDHEEDILLLLDLLQSHLQEWPPLYRNTPKHWLEHWTQESPDHRLKLISMLSLERGLAGPLHDRRLRAILDMCGSLHGLQLNGQALGEASAVLLSEHESCRQLRILGLGGTLMDDESVRCLTRKGCFENLQVLQLNNTVLSDQSVFYLTSSASFRLKVLHLDQCLLSDRGVEALATCEMMRGLNVLTLSGNSLTSRALFHLADSPYLHQLHTLDISGVTLTSLDAEVLTQSSNASSLQTLRAVDCGSGVELLRRWAEEHEVRLWTEEN
jgi:hypothetical protein